MLCYEKLVNTTILRQRTKLRKRLVSYFKSSGITTLKKYVNQNHFLIPNILGENLNNNIKTLVERQPTKKRSMVIGSDISKFFGAINHYNKDNVH
jgi:Fe-S cluster biosynthesis and repair protein YggX